MPEDNVMDSGATPDAPGQRTLAAIVFTDAVGFSARVGENEERTVKLIKSDLDLMATLCKRFEGQVIKSNGDGLMMMFTSAVQAVTCALEIQKILTEQAKSQPDALMHRIGVHLGDVLISQGDALGDGVNVASRLEQEAEPGGICMSQTVYDVVKNRLFLQAARIGDLKLKNIAEPVAAYRVAGVAKAKKHNKVYRLNWGLIAGLSIVVVGSAVGATILLVNKGGKASGTQTHGAVAANDPALSKLQNETSSKPTSPSGGQRAQREGLAASVKNPPAAPTPPTTQSKNGPTTSSSVVPTNSNVPTGTGALSPGSSSGTPGTSRLSPGPLTSQSNPPAPGTLSDAYLAAWRQYMPGYHFKWMANWIAAHPDQIPAGETVSAIHDRYYALGDFILWFTDSMSAYGPTNPLAFKWKKADGTAWVTPNGAITLKLPTETIVTGMRKLLPGQIGSLARAIMARIGVDANTRADIRNNIESLVGVFMEHGKLINRPTTNK